MPWLERFREWGRSRCWVDTKRYELKGPRVGRSQSIRKGRQSLDLQRLGRTSQP
jgi:hypothetical protein